MIKDIYDFLDRYWGSLLKSEFLHVFLHKRDFPASELDWGRINHFTSREHWGDLDKVSAILVILLDKFRDYCDVPFYLTPAGEGASYCTTGHARESWHYVIEDRHPYALAVDFFPKLGYADIGLIAIHKGWRGVGIYPDTKYPRVGAKAHMLHFDLRFTEPLYWIRRKGEYHYYTTYEDIEKAVDSMWSTV